MHKVFYELQDYKHLMNSQRILKGSKDVLFSVCKKKKKNRPKKSTDFKQRLNITLTHRCCDGGSRRCWDDCQSALEAESFVGKQVNFLLRSSVCPQGIPWLLHPLDCWVDIPCIQILTSFYHTSNQINSICKAPHHIKVISGHLMWREGLGRSFIKPLIPAIRANTKATVARINCLLHIIKPFS